MCGVALRAEVAGTAAARLATLDATTRHQSAKEPQHPRKILPANRRIPGRDPGEAPRFESTISAATAARSRGSGAPRHCAPFSFAAVGLFDAAARPVAA